MSYQSFPWENGDSKSFAKLSCLHLPILEGKKVLDVGCNAGYFCGFAKFAGAENVTGIDNNNDFLETARALFPDCTFICKDWNDLGNEKYDIIIFLSAIHYAADQKAIIDYLMQRLNPGGTLVLEIGVAPGNEDTFVEVERSIDKRKFPTGRKLAAMLEPYAAKYVGLSVNQKGDPIRRNIYHVRNKLPIAVLVLDEPHSGKSSVAHKIFSDKLEYVSGDVLYHQIKDGEISVCKEIIDIVTNCIENNEVNCAAAAYNIGKHGFIPQLCELIAAKVGNHDFLLDMYLSKPYRPIMCDSFEKLGYFVVSMNLWQARANPHSKNTINPDLYQKYMNYLSNDFLINEDTYLAANPDVAKAVKEGRMPNGQFHYLHFGKKEGRKVNDQGDNTE